MCGICGIYNFQNESVAPDFVHRMVQCLKHRGPDGSGMHHQGAVAFGHTRLAIIDRSDTGSQPMVTEDASLWITFNGEIYNYRELRAILANIGYSFRGQSDTEVILRAYEAWGIDCLQRFTGMWAFALWDDRQKKLILARDRFGIKPLYYYQDKHQLVFASEAKAILASGQVAFIPEYRSIREFLINGFVDRGRETFFENIYQVLPGEYVVANQSAVKIETYWSFRSISSERSFTLEEASELLFRHLESSVELCLRSDVEVGLTLSGGLDSNTIAVLMKQMTNKRLHTYTSYYDAGKAFDERSLVQDASAKLGLDLHMVEPNPAQFFALLPRIIWHLDMPTRSPCVYAQWHIYERASKDVKVMLTGQGSDEIFGGYEGYYALALISMLCNTFAAPSRTLSVVEAWVGNISALKMSAWDVLLGEPHVYQMNQRKGHTRRLTMLGARISALVDVLEREPLCLPSMLNNRLYWDLHREVLPTLLRYEDRMSMAFSLETRVPFLDHHIVEFALALPDKFKVVDGRGKYILRRAMDRYLSPTITWERKKQGLATPIAGWLRNGLQAEAFAHCESLVARDILDRAYMVRIFDEHIRHLNDHSLDIWRWISLETWFRLFQ